MIIEWYSGSVLTSVNINAKITPKNINGLENGTLGEDGYCTAQEPCTVNEGDCDFNTHCIGNDVQCINDGCHDSLGFVPGTDCCLDISCRIVDMKNGLLFSPFYPNWYEDNLQCSEQITVAPGKIITIQFDTFDVSCFQWRKNYPNCQRII